MFSAFVAVAVAAALAAAPAAATICNNDPGLGQVMACYCAGSSRSVQDQPFDVTFVDGGADGVCEDRSDPNLQPNTFDPILPLSNFDGMTDTTWHITLRDNMGIDDGYLQSVCITPFPAATPTCVSFERFMPDNSITSVAVPIVHATPVSGASIQIVGNATWHADYSWHVRVEGNTAPPRPAAVFPPEFFGVDMISYSDVTLMSGNVGGRIAARDNFVGGTASSVGADVCDSDLSLAPGVGGSCAGGLGQALIVGRDASWTSGAMFPAAAATCGTNGQVAECAFVAGAITGNPGPSSPLSSQVCNNTATGPCTGAGCTDPIFAESRGAALSTLADLSAPTDTATFASKWGGLELTCSDPMAEVNKISIPAADWTAATWFSTNNCFFGGRWIFHLTGGDVDFSGGSPPVVGDLAVYAIPGAVQVNVSGMQVKGTIMAPEADIYQNGGNVKGLIIGNSYTGNPASITRVECAARLSYDDVTVFMGPSTPGQRRQSATNNNPYCLPNDVLAVPSHGPLRAGDTVTLNGAEQAEIAELLLVANEQPALRFTADLTGSYPTRTATVESSINPGTREPVTPTAVGTYCSSSAPNDDDVSAATPAAIALTGLAAAGIALSA